MDSDCERGRGDPVGDAADPTSVPVEVGQDTALDEDELDEAELFDDDEGGEATQVTPHALMDMLRQASRASASARQQIGDDDETLMFSASHPRRDRRRRWLRSASPWAGAAIASLLVLPADHGVDAPGGGHEHERAELAAAAARASHLTVQEVAEDQTGASAPEASGTSDSHAADPSTFQAGASPRSLPPAAPPPYPAGTLAIEARWARALTRGEDQLSQREYDAAALSFERAIGYKPEDVRGYAGLGAAALGRERWNEAIWAFRKAIALAPEDATLHANLGNAYEGAGKTNLAAKEQLRARQLNPRE